MRAGWLLKVETSPPCNPALDKKEQKMDDEMIQITPQSVLTWKHHEAVSTLSSMWCHLE